MPVLLVLVNESCSFAFVVRWGRGRGHHRWEACPSLVLPHLYGWRPLWPHFNPVISPKYQKMISRVLQSSVIYSIAVGECWVCRWRKLSRKRLQRRKYPHKQLFWLWNHSDKRHMSFEFEVHFSVTHFSITYTIIATTAIFSFSGLSRFELLPAFSWFPCSDHNSAKFNPTTCIVSWVLGVLKLWRTQEPTQDWALSWHIHSGIATVHAGFSILKSH